MLSKRFKCLGEGADLDQAIAVDKEVTLTLHCPAHLLNFFDMTDSLKDLREALTQYSKLEVVDTDNERIGSQFLRFAADFHESFGQSDKIEDLETAIALFQEGLALLPVHHPIHLAGSNIFAKRERFNRLSGQEDLDEAISVHREQLGRLLMSDPDRSRSLHNLAGALAIRNHYFGRPSDIDETIPLHQEVLEQRLAYREALKLKPIPYPDRCVLQPCHCTNYTISPIRDLDEAISLH
jgi:tetratricopeptide (TPR) repeat protein